jgi:hypothetical protein
MLDMQGRQQTPYEMRMGELITRKFLVGINRESIKYQNVSCTVRDMTRFNRYGAFTLSTPR